MGDDGGFGAVSTEGREWGLTMSNNQPLIDPRTEEIIRMAAIIQAQAELLNFQSTTVDNFVEKVKRLEREKQKLQELLTSKARVLLITPN